MRAGQATVRRAAPVARKAAEQMEQLAEGMAAANQVTRVGFAPIVRVDEARREVELCATSEAVDSHGTVFDYAASKDAFTRWIGNVREMHERRAVGSRAAVRFDDTARKVFVRVHISRGAEDTWEKILDGTLRGASIGASNVTWERQTRRVAGRERRITVATHYDLVELSLVDNPSNPDALGVTIVRDAAPDPALLDELESETTEAAKPASTSDPKYGDTIDTTDVWAAGKDAGPAASPSMRSLWPDDETPPPSSCECLGRHQQRHMPALDPIVASTVFHPKHAEHAEHQEHSTPRAETLRALGAFSTNAEGYPDTGVPAQAEARPTADLGVSPDGNLRARFHAAARGILMGCGCPLCIGAIAALGETGDTLEEAPAGLPANRRATTNTQREHLENRSEHEQRVELALVRAVAAGLQASATQLERMDEGVQGLRTLVGAAVNQMSGTVGDIKIRLDALEAQPIPGGPAARVAEKALALAPQGASTTGGMASDPLRALESLAGRLRDPQAQIAVAAELIRLQREG